MIQRILPQKFKDPEREKIREEERRKIMKEMKREKLRDYYEGRHKSHLRREKLIGCIFKIFFTLIGCAKQ